MKRKKDESWWKKKQQVAEKMFDEQAAPVSTLFNIEEFLD